MPAKVILHLPDHERKWLEAGNMSRLYLRIKQLVEKRGGQVEIAPRFPPKRTDGNLHIVDNARQPHMDVLIAAVAYLDKCWHLDPMGVLADSMIGEATFDPDRVDAAQAQTYVKSLQARFSEARYSRYEQKEAVEEIDPEGIVVFLQGPPPYRRGHAFMSRDEMLACVLEQADGRPVYIKPHPQRKDEGIEVIAQLRADGYAPIVTHANVHDLLRQAAVTVSANSAASLEGLLHGTPALLFARSDFAAGVEEVKSAGDFPAAMQRALARPRDYTKFLYWYFSQCFWLEDEGFEEQVLERFALIGFDAEVLGLTL